MKKMTIGITMYLEPRNRTDFASVNNTYINAVRDADALPMLIPILPGFDDYSAYLEKTDALLFTGGGDILPILYDTDISPKIKSISTDRDNWEIELCKAAKKIGMPILGICRGQQLINVALGGTLIQDIPSEVPSAMGHSPEINMDEGTHYIEISDTSSRLYAIFGRQKLLTNSFHHQAVKDLAPGLKTVARTSDGIIEAIETTDPSHFLVGVQFHPEALTRRYPEFLKLFTALAAAAAEFRGKLIKA